MKIVEILRFHVYVFVFLFVSGTGHGMYIVGYIYTLYMPHYLG